METHFTMISPKESLVEKAGEILLSSEELENNIVVFPGKRPAHFLRKYLVEKKGGALPSPGIFSMDAFVDFVFSRLGRSGKPVSQLDLAAILYDRLKDTAAAVIGQNPGRLDLDSFLPWAFKLISDFEELRIELKTVKDLSAYDLLLPEEVRSSAAYLKKFSGFSKLYGAFYECIETENLLTRSIKYARSAEGVENLDLSKYGNVIFAGFFGITGAEKLLFKGLSKRPNVSFLLESGPGIEEQFSFLSPPNPSPLPPIPSSPTTYHFYKSSDTHGQIFKLGQVLNNSKSQIPNPKSQTNSKLETLNPKQFTNPHSAISTPHLSSPPSPLTPLPYPLGSDSVIVLPASESLFPLVQNVLPEAGEYNVSMGYPLTSTPVYALIDALADLMDKRSGDKYFLPHYINFAFHPYVKNIYLTANGDTPHSALPTPHSKLPIPHSSLRIPNSAEPSRIILQSVEEVFSARVNRYIELSEIENDGEILEEAALKCGLSRADVKAHLESLHSRLIRPFEKISDVGDFAGKLLQLISHISENSTASLHAYWSPFARVVIESVNELAASRLNDRKFESFGSYFKLFRNFIGGVSYPFPGTPLKGLQVLGFLETRNLKFKKVYFLDANADVLPRSRKEDTILSHYIREKLGLSTAGTRERTAAYYFGLLTAGAEEVHIFYKDSAEKERSPFVEKLIWGMEREGRKPGENEVYFRIKFSQEDPKPVAKDAAVAGRLKGMEYSPSAIDSYLKCGLKFYYRYVLRISEKDEVSDEIEQRDIGTIVHEILQEFFLKRLGRPLKITDADFKEMEKISLGVFNSRFRHHDSGFEYLIKRQIEKRLAEVLEHHRDNLGGVKIKNCEGELKSSIKTKYGGIKLKGRADRIDERRGVITIIDYKTGYMADVPNWQKFELEDRESWPDRLKSVQLPVYVYSYLRDNPGSDISGVDASLMLLGGKEIEEKSLFYESRGKSPERGAIFEKYMKATASLLEEILDPGRPFGPGADEKECGACSFKTICGRQWV